MLCYYYRQCNNYLCFPPGNSINYIKGAAFSDTRLLGPQQQENRFQYGVHVIGYGQEPIAALINYQFVNKI